MESHRPKKGISVPEPSTGSGPESLLRSARPLRLKTHPKNRETFTPGFLGGERLLFFFGDHAMMTPTQSTQTSAPVATACFDNVFDGDMRCPAGSIPNLKVVMQQPHPNVPKEHPEYVFQKDQLRDLLAFLYKPNNDALFITGPTGCGKTSIVNEVCARLKWPVQEITCNARMEFQTLKGQFMLSSAAPGQTPTMHFAYGPLATAMKEGHVLILNEIDLCDPGELAGLNDILEGRPLVIAENGGEVIEPHPNFRVIATANSAGSGDATGFYAGVQPQNIAALDRYRWIRASYMPVKVECEVVKLAVKQFARAEMNDIVSGMVVLAGALRKMFEAGKLSVTMSTRTLVRWAHIAEDFRNCPCALRYGLERALLFRLEPHEAAAIEEQASIIFGPAWQSAKAAPKKRN